MLLTKHRFFTWIQKFLMVRMRYSSVRISTSELFGTKFEGMEKKQDVIEEQRMKYRNE